MKSISSFSISKEHKQMLKSRAEAGHRTMTGHLEKLIENDYKHHEEYQAYLCGESRDPRD